MRVFRATPVGPRRLTRLAHALSASESVHQCAEYECEADSERSERGSVGRSPLATRLEAYAPRLHCSASRRAHSSYTHQHSLPCVGSAKHSLGEQRVSTARPPKRTCTTHQERDRGFVCRQRRSFFIKQLRLGLAWKRRKLRVHPKACGSRPRSAGKAQSLPKENGFLRGVRHPRTRRSRPFL